MERTMASDPTETATSETDPPNHPSAARSAARAAPASAAAAPAAPTLESVGAERDAAQQQAQEYLALAQRAQADFQNYRRRAEQERTEAFDRGRGEVLLQILPVLDDFERAMQALPTD